MKRKHEEDAAPLRFDIAAAKNKARVAKLTLPHGEIDTPVFMPVGTQGTIKGLTSQQVRTTKVAATIFVRSMISAVKSFWETLITWA